MFSVHSHTYAHADIHTSYHLHTFTYPPVFLWLVWIQNYHNNDNESICRYSQSCLFLVPPHSVSFLLWHLCFQSVIHYRGFSPHFVSVSFALTHFKYSLVSRDLSKALNTLSKVLHAAPVLQDPIGTVPLSSFNVSASTPHVSRICLLHCIKYIYYQFNGMHAFQCYC